jgi:hypothetical protein
MAITIGPGCGHTEEPRAAVAGSVLLDGTPLAEGEIYFVSPGLPPQMLTIRAGRFQGTLLPGNVRVEIYAYRTVEAAPIDPASPPAAEGPELGAARVNIVPARFNQESDLRAEIPPSGQTDLTFAIESQ